MASTSVSIEVWRGANHPMEVRRFQNGRDIERIIVIQGDCLDLELEDNQYFIAFPHRAADANEGEDWTFSLAPTLKGGVR